MSPRFSLYSFAAIAVLLAITIPAAAQNRYQHQGPPMQKHKTVGTLLVANGNQMQVATSANTEFIMMGPNTQISVTGTADQEYLKSGVNVEFVADVPADLKVASKIEHVTVFTPSQDRPIGLAEPEIGAAPKKSEKGDKDDNAADKAKPAHDPGVGDAAPAGGHKPRSNKEAESLLGNDLLSGSNKPSKAHGGAPKPPGTFTVRGMIRSVSKDGLITVAAGHYSVKISLSPDATIDVDLTDLHVAQREDKVTVQGMVSQARPNMVIAESVSIELVNPLSGKKHSSHTSKAPSPRIKPKKDAGDDAPAAK